MTCSVVLRRDFVAALPHWFRKVKLGDWPMFALAARHGTLTSWTRLWLSIEYIREASGRPLPSISSARGYRNAESPRQAFRVSVHRKYDRQSRDLILNWLSRATNGNRAETAKHLVSASETGDGDSPAVGGPWQGSLRTHSSAPGIELFSRAK